MKYIHLGYYNDKPDLRDYFYSKPNEIVEDMLNGFGHFYTTDGEDYDFPDETDEYIVKSSLPKEMGDITENDFIDIYKRMDNEEGLLVFSLSIFNEDGEEIDEIDLTASNEDDMWRLFDKYVKGDYKDYGDAVITDCNPY